MDALRGRCGLLLLAILGAALAIRLATIRFGLPALNDPDEMMFELGALRMLRGPTLNPGWFGHPATTTMYVLALVNVATFGAAWLIGRVASAGEYTALVYVDPSWMILPGRIAMTLFAIGTIWLTWRLATRFFGVGAGLFAALLLALNPVHITYSQIIRSDMMACFFMLLSLQASCLIAERGRRRDYGWAALWLGVAIATKWPFALAGMSMTCAALLAYHDRILTARQMVVRLAGAWIAAIITLFLVSPYLLIDYAIVLRNLRGEKQLHHLGATGGDGWHNLWWYLSGPLQNGFGVVGLALVLVGMVYLPRHRLAFMILVPVATAFMLLLCAQQLVWERWALPLMLIGAIVAGLGLMRLVAMVSRLATPRNASVVLSAVLIATLIPLGWRARSDGVARMNDTRQQATEWARRHVPPGRSMLVEHFAFDMLDRPWRFLFPMGDAGCVDARALLYGKTGYATIEQARGSRSNIDYGTIPPARRMTCRADIAILTQADRYRVERRDFPQEYAAYRALIANGTVVATFRPQPGRESGPVVTILDLRR